MKDDRFIELVNLYIDRQITAAETAQLESEIQSNPRRRAEYKQYCQIHRASTLVYESFRAQAPHQSVVPPSAQGSIAQFETGRRQRRFRWPYYAGGLAAAACLGLVFGRLNSKPTTEINLLANNDLPASIAARPEMRIVASPGRALAEPQVGLVSLRNNTTTEPDYAALLAALRREEERAYADSQIRSGRLTSLFEDGVFDSQQVMPAKSQRIFRGKQTPAQQAEFTAFQFQR